MGMPQYSAASAVITAWARSISYGFIEKKESIDTYCLFSFMYNQILKYYMSVYICVFIDHRLKGGI